MRGDWDSRILAGYRRRRVPRDLRADRLSRLDARFELRPPHRSDSFPAGARPGSRSLCAAIHGLPRACDSEMRERRRGVSALHLRAGDYREIRELWLPAWRPAWWRVARRYFFARVLRGLRRLPW